MSMAILAIGHGSGMAVRQCNNLEVSSGVILGKAPPVGWCCYLFAVAFLLCCVCSRAAMCTLWIVSPCRSTKALRYLHARIAALRVLGPFSAWFLYAAASISRASSSGCLEWSFSVAAFARGVPLSGTSWVCGTLAGMLREGCTLHPSKTSIWNRYTSSLGLTRYAQKLRIEVKRPGKEWLYRHQESPYRSFFLVGGTKLPQDQLSYKDTCLALP